MQSGTYIIESGLACVKNFDILVVLGELPDHSLIKQLERAVKSWRCHHDFDKGVTSDSGLKIERKMDAQWWGWEVKARKVKIKFEEAASEDGCEKPRVGEPTKSRHISVCLMQCE